MTGKIYLGKGEEIKYIGVKNDLVSKFKEFIFKPNAQWYIYVGIVVIGYMFYQLGYSFLYGFYFGGGKLFPSLMDVMVNQVPFEFKFLAITGLIVSISFLCFCLTLFKYIEATVFLTKFIWIMLYLITFVFIYFLCSLITGMGLNPKNDREMFKLLIISGGLIASLVFFLKLIVEFENHTFDGGVNILVVLFYTITLININVIIGDRLHIEEDMIYTIIAIEAIIVIGILDYCLRDKSNENKNYKLIAPIIKLCLPMFILFICIWFKLFNELVQTIPIISLLIVLNLIKFVKHRRNGNTKLNNKNQINQQGDKKNHTILTEENKGIAIVGSLISIIVIIFLGAGVYSVFYFIGNFFGERITLDDSKPILEITQSTITYYNTDGTPKTENGVVVAQKDNTYYISTKDRKLVVISSPYVTIE